MPTKVSFLPYTRTFSRILIAGALLCLAPQAAPRAWAQAPAEPQAADSGTAAAPVGPDDVVLTVGGEKITAKEFEKLMQGLPPEVAGALPSIGKRGFAERYANLLNLAKEGEKRKVDDNDNFRQMLAFQRLMLLAQLTVNSMVATVGSISPEEVGFYYTSHQPDFQQVKLRAIYIAFSTAADAAKAGTPAKQPAPKAAKPKLTEVEAKAKAEEIRSRMRGGETMEAIAKKESDDPTAAKGGDMGFKRRGEFPPQIDNVIFALEPNQVSIPVRDRFGYYLFRVEEKRSQPLDEVKAVIENALRQGKVGEALSKVQSDSPVTLEPRYFGAAQPAAPAAP
jgi:parvulin-like peptidyl-prolyl isomerase